MTFLTQKKIIKKVKEHLIAQGEPATKKETGQCQYLTETNLQCGVGCLIKSDFYDPRFEGTGVYYLRPFKEHGVISEQVIPLIDLLDQALLNSKINTNDKKIRELLIKIQTIHDEYVVGRDENWQSYLIKAFDNLHTMDYK